ncbi:glucose n-acetyltransferase 1 [Acrodontium crateriforme]|uniref:Glucose n-acetyltransferase 1 n=1 Tax=Acrodontium crateriforme TaxID=150365 RepID=A0AAQ3M9W0_9PEZI|nr:glucose n-acetyltransferase 1 [Acrodontium crateriforme]
MGLSTCMISMNRARPGGRQALAAVILVFVVFFLFLPKEYGVRDFSGLSWLTHPSNVLIDDIDWSEFAYCTYATSSSDLCNSVMLLEALHQVDVRADRVLLFSREWDVDGENVTDEVRLLRRARDEYGAKLQPIDILRADDVTDPTWAAGFTKWLAFNQTQYKRVLTLDSDGTILRPMDELFLLPSVSVAMPRAYWLNDSLSAQVTLVQPSSSAFSRIQEQIAKRGPNDFDMEIINALYEDSCMVIPHRPYNLLTGEFRKEGSEHAAYLADPDEQWDPIKIMGEAKYIHFSDWPLPKPWAAYNDEVKQKIMPKCGGIDEPSDNECADRKLWNWLYDDFRDRRTKVCGSQFRSWER